jgi:S-adenosylmethionine synthetase
MEKMKILFTSESVSEGHPDKVCDRISDAILDACLAQDPKCHVACETFATGKDIIVSGEITQTVNVDYKKIVRDVLKDIGYNSEDVGTDYKTVNIDIRIKPQSPDIDMGVSKASLE